MRIFRVPPAATEPVALTIGNFDGVHRGHQAMLARLAEAADDLRLPAAVMTFEPHPREFFAPQSAPSRLTPLRTKLELLQACGVARVFVARFDARLANLAPEAFIHDVLRARLDARWVLVGDDFRFGHKRAGDLEVLRAHATAFSVEAMHTVQIEGERASSSAVRTALHAGDLARAGRLLGRRYAITGRVAHGEKLGRKLGFPTANLPLRQPPPLRGIFAVHVHGLPGGPHNAVASLGTRPTLRAGSQPLLEVFILDFGAPIYGCRIRVEFLHKLRDEARYPDLDALARQIGADVAQARDWFRTAHA